MITVRLAKEEDTAAIVAMGRRFWEAAKVQSGGLTFDEESFGGYFRMMVWNPLFVVFVAEGDNGIIQGSIGAVLQPWFCNRNLMTVEEIFWWVSDEFRGTRAGILLHRALMQFAEEAGAATVSMSIEESIGNSDKLDRYYRRCGFNPASRTYLKSIQGEQYA